MVHSTGIFRCGIQLLECPLYWLHVLVQAALTLSDKAERTCPFASPMGRLMVTQRTNQAAAKQVQSHVLNSLNGAQSLTCQSVTLLLACSLTHPLARSLARLKFSLVHRAENQKSC